MDIFSFIILIVNFVSFCVFVCVENTLASKAIIICCCRLLLKLKCLILCKFRLNAQHKPHVMDKRPKCLIWISIESLVIRLETCGFSLQFWHQFFACVCVCVCVYCSLFVSNSFLSTFFAHGFCAYGKMVIALQASNW